MWAPFVFLFIKCQTRREHSSKSGSEYYSNELLNIAFSYNGDVLRGNYSSRTDKKLLKWHINLKTKVSQEFSRAEC